MVFASGVRSGSRWRNPERNEGPLSNQPWLNPLVPSKGLEPPHRCRYMDLNHARLPIPPRWQVDFRCSGSRKLPDQETCLTILQARSRLSTLAECRWDWFERFHRRHPERGHLSGGARDLAWRAQTFRAGFLAPLVKTCDTRMTHACLRLCQPKCRPLLILAYSRESEGGFFTLPATFG